MFSTRYICGCSDPDFPRHWNGRVGKGMASPRALRALLFFPALLLLLAIYGCAGKKQPPPPPPPQVTVTRPVQRTVSDFLELNGTTRAVRTVQLVARVPGYLEQVLFRDGQMVHSGQTLFIIQQSTTRARLVQTEAQILQQKAQLDYAEKQLIRFSNMLRLNAAAKSDVDNWQFQRDSALGNLKNAEAQRDLALLDLRYTVVSAPFSGRIDRHLKDRGNLVGAGENTVLAEMSQVDPIYVYFTISDLDLARLMKSAHGVPGQKGGGGWPMAAALPGEEAFPHSGRLNFAASTLTDTTGTLLMRGVIPNASGAILPGLQARVRVPLERRRAWLVPDTAVQSDQQGMYLLVVTPANVVERRPVRTGMLVDHLRVIEEGLQGGESVVVNGQLRAAPGKKVTPAVEAGAPGGEPPGPELPAAQAPATHAPATETPGARTPGQAPAAHPPAAHSSGAGPDGKGAP
jgi:RND family efflux transporter MFP subunit